jgi:exopolyphosphatase/guanosine-5'-triphosphate,3'-diphosphate pyrophosphatase
VFEHVCLLALVACFARRSLQLIQCVGDISVVATSALRDAVNGEDAIARARARTGLEIRSLTAAEEAHYAYVAAVNSST